MAYFGLDIGSYSIKFVSSSGTGSGAKIKKYGSVPNPVGQILPNDKTLFEQLALAIKQGLKDNSLLGQNCHLALPGPQAYVSIINMPVLSDAELASAIKWEAEQHVPVSLKEVNFEYDVIFRPPKKSIDDEMSVFLVGAPKKKVDRYLELLDLVGIEAIGLEPEVVSLVRLFVEGQKRESSLVTTMVCNVGALSTSFVVFDEQGKMGVVHSASIGSLALTRALETNLSLQPSQAEEYKRTYGLEQDKLEGKVRIVLLPVFDTLVREIRKTMQFYLSKDPSARGINRVVMFGGGANLPGLSSYLAQILSVEVIVGDPFIGYEVSNRLQLGNDRASYGVAVGLSVKEF